MGAMTQRTILAMGLVANLALSTLAAEVPKKPEVNMSRARSTNVGIWYCTYYGDDWTNWGEMTYPPTLYRPLCSGKPGDYRAYNATNVAVIDYHLQQIAEAQIDFLLFELTPGGLGGYRHSMDLFVDNARVVAKRIKIWNDRHPWKIRYAVAAGAHRDVYGNDPIGLCMEKEAQDVYDHFCNNPDYGGPTNYYQLDGKPLIVYWGDRNQNTAAWNSYTGDKTYGNRFAVRYAQDVGRGSYGWNIYSNGTVLDSEVEVVSPGWGHYNRATPPYVSRQKGDFYTQCWNTVLTNSRPKIVMIVAFNDYLENTAVWTADTTHLTDADKWIGPDGQDHPSLYWDLTIRSIQALRRGPFAITTNAGAGKAMSEESPGVRPMQDNIAYRFDGKISREVLERYLSRAITQMGLTDSPQRAEDIRMLKHVGAKFIGRAACMWLTPENPDDAADFRKCRETADLVHKADPDVILEACIFEAVSTGVNKIPVPAWVFEAFGLAPERRAFNYDAMLYDGGKHRDLWGKGGSAPDMSKQETRMWFVYRAVNYIDAGFEAIHFGQVHLMNQNDPGNKHWIDVLNRVRAHAVQHARRHLVLCNSHTHGIVEDGKLLFDFHCWPVRPKEVAGKPMETVLEAGHGDAIFGQSKGGKTPSGWECEHLPYLVEVDNWASSGKGGQSIGFCWVWGYDEICWFARQSPEYRNQWLRYAWQWVREHDTNGWLEMPGQRYLADPVAGVATYHANMKSKAAPNGCGQEDTIKALWAEEDKHAERK